MGLDLFELVMALESEFVITIPENRFCECRTVGDISRLVHELAPERDTRDVVQRVAQVIANEFGMKAADISGGDRLIEDLRLD